MVIVFDLDDTLYDELSYVRSGLSGAASFLSDRLNLKQEMVLHDLHTELQSSRINIFNRFLEKQNVLTNTLLKQCISIYRSHQPSLILYPEAEECLGWIKKPIYIVTDGNKLVQQKKLQTLQLPQRVRRCLCTHAYGIKYAKPSPYCFLKICFFEKVSPQKVVYIADNPHKDFVGIKSLGLLTIRVKTGQYKTIVKDQLYEAHIQISTLAHLREALKSFE